MALARCIAPPATLVSFPLANAKSRADTVVVKPVKTVFFQVLFVFPGDEIRILQIRVFRRIGADAPQVPGRIAHSLLPACQRWPKHRKLGTGFVHHVKD